MLDRFAMPALLAPVSFLFGNYFEMAAWFAHIQSPTFLLFPRLPTLLACAAAWCVFPLLCQRRRWTLLEAGCGALIVLLVLLVVRPLFITEAMAQMPILRSMRWPFREILQLLFFFHLLLVIRPWAGSAVFQNRIACFSLALFVLPLFFTPPLSLNPLNADRTALLSGQADRFWRAVKAQLRPGDEIATIIPDPLWQKACGEIPYAMTGTADFPAYFQVRCLSGYSQTAPTDQLRSSIRPYFWFGAYSPDQVPLIMKGNPHLRLLVVSQFYPLKMTLSNTIAGGPPLDLAP